jgi:hypothetical protein
LQDQSVSPSAIVPESGTTLFAECPFDSRLHGAIFTNFLARRSRVLDDLLRGVALGNGALMVKARARRIELLCGDSPDKSRLLVIFLAVVSALP